MFYVAKEDVVDCDIGGERALLNLDSNKYFTLNQTASEVWVALSERCSVDQIVKNITDKYDVAEKTCRSDVESILASMISANIAQEAGPVEAG